jgi:LysM repeat protein
MNTTKKPLLQYGDEGEEVAIIQEELRVLGYFVLPISGTFDEKTRQAVYQFQMAYQIDPTGIVDATTLQQLQLASSRDTLFVSKSITLPTLRLGDSGNAVIQLQNQLTNLLYYTGSINGIFDVATQNAVKRFQSINKITADGVVGRDTWAALSYLYSPLSSCNNENNNTYIVQANDTLYSIARKYNMSVEELKRLNNLMTNAIHIGQELIVSKPSSTYTVTAGDTLYSIARMFNITVDELKRVNNLTSNTLTIGQTLIIPKLTSNTYTVQVGDTLYKIAQKYNTTIDVIMKLNNLTTTNLKIGEVLQLPN